ncbi:MAG: BatA domain-containing protein [Acidobacteriota bacterium]
MPSFLSPLFLIGALAAAVPIVLHLLRREPEPRVRFAAVRLLRGAPVEYTDRRRLRELLLLALRVTALILLALAFARPFLASATAVRSAGATVVALDTSYSMSAPGVFARARELAKNAVNQVASGDLVGVVTFADAPAVASALGADRALSLSAIDAAAPGFGATRYRGALSAAVQALGGRRGTVVVVTDLQESGWDAGDRASVPDGVRIQVSDVGAVRSNLAVTGVRAAGDRVIVSVRNSGEVARETRAQLALDGRRAGEVPVSVGPHATSEVEFAGGAAASTATVTIDDRDGIPADDVRYALLDSASRPGVLIVTSSGDPGRDAFYLQQALATGSAGGRFYRAAGATAAQLGTQDTEPIAANAAVVLLSTRGLERRGREALATYVRGGGGLLMAIGPDVDGEVVADVLGPDAPLRIAAVADATPMERSLVPIDVRHPLFQSFGERAPTLALITFRRVARVDGAGCRAIARLTTGEAAILDCETGEGRAIVLASDLDNRWNDFPLRTTFVPFVHETLRYLSGTRLHDGEFQVADVPDSVPPRPGFATITENRGRSVEKRRIVVNVDPRESDLSRMSEQEFQGAVTRLKEIGASEARVEARQQEDRQHLWMYALGLMLAALAVESLVASRTA